MVGLILLRQRSHSFPLLQCSLNIICIKLFFTVFVQICLVSSGCIFHVILCVSVLFFL